MSGLRCSPHVEAGWNYHGLCRVEHPSAKRWEDIPESECLIAGACHDVLAARADR